MFTSRIRLLLIVLVGVTILAAIPWLQGQEPAPRTEPAPTEAARPVAANSEAPAKGPDSARMTVQQRHLFLAAQRSADWLRRANKPDGRFVHGFLPSLRMPLEGDQYLRQVGATQGLGRAASFFGDERAAAVARQAVLTLLLETAKDKDAEVRYTAAPSGLINRTAAAGMLILAILELPKPANDLREQAHQLANYLGRQIKDDGSMTFFDATDENKSSEQEAIEHYSGIVLHALVRSAADRGSRNVPPWQFEYLDKAVPHYQACWQQKKNFPMVPGHTAALTEAFAITRKRACADAVFAMNDWLCTLQYQNVDPRNAHWNGGFMPWVDGKALAIAPDIRSAAAAESLANAYVTAKWANDVTRQKRYKEALESCLQFLTTLQYTEANTQHFAEWYRPLLVGGFYASSQDGTLRIDYTQHALVALVQYLDQVAELPRAKE